MWKEIQAWYKRNGFKLASADMEAIMCEWHGHEKELLSILNRWGKGREFMAPYWIW